jgi:hypothetical protein
MYWTAVWFVRIVAFFELVHWLMKLRSAAMGPCFGSDPSPYAHPSIEWVTQDALALECRSYNKIRELVAGVSESAEEDVWEVKSGNNKYKVVLNSSLLRNGKQSSVACLVKSCGCMDHIQRGPICKHAGAVLSVMMAKRSVAEESFSTPECQQFLLSPRAEPEPEVKKNQKGKEEEKSKVTVDAAVKARDEEKELISRARAVMRAEAAMGSAGSVQLGGGQVSASCFAGLREKALRLAGIAEEGSVDPPAGYGKPEVKNKAEVPVEAAVKSVRIAENVVRDTGGGVGDIEEVSMGAVLSVMDAVATQETAIREISRAKRMVHLNAYSFDRADVVAALVAARKRGLDVKVAMDKGMTLKGKTRDQLSMCKELMAAGIRVHVAEGDNLTAVYRAVGRSIPGHLKGIMHQKSAMIDDLVIIGSCNWTTSSRGNFEIGVLFKVEPSHRDIVKELLEVPFASGQELTIAAVEEAQRARSESPTGRGFRRR